MHLVSCLCLAVVSWQLLMFGSCVLAVAMFGSCVLAVAYVWQLCLGSCLCLAVVSWQLLMFGSCVLAVAYVWQLCLGGCLCLGDSVGSGSSHNAYNTDFTINYCAILQF